MSRTDVHRPGWVKERDPYVREMRAVHRHTDGPCDLGAALRAKRDTKTRCYMTYVGGRNIYCGCRLCTMHDYRKVGNGRRRAALRADRQRLLRDREHEPTAKRHDAW